MNEFMLMGILVGVVIGLVIVAILLKVTKNNGKMKCEYDERQTSVRGKGFKISFFSLIIYDGIYGLLGIVVDKPLIDPLVAMMIGICLTVAINVVYCIWHDAYFSLNENPKRLLVAFAAIAIFNLIIGIVNIMNGEVITDGELNFRITNLICGILFVVIFITLLAKKFKNKDLSESEAI